MARETSPLLENADPIEAETAPETPLIAASGEGAAKHPRYPSAILIVFAICILADAGSSLLGVPEVRAFEMAVCRDYYVEHDPTVIGEPPRSYVDESLCKLREIQTRMAYLRATKGLIMTIPGEANCPMYRHSFTSRTDFNNRGVGRKLVVFLALLGQILEMFATIGILYFHRAFSTNMVLLTPIFRIIGGGNRVLMASLNSIVVDTVPPSVRPTVFYIIGAGLLITETIMIPIGSQLLLKDLWLAFKVSMPILVASLVLVGVLPETHVPKHGSHDGTDDASVDSSNTSKPLLHILLQRGADNVKKAKRGLGGLPKGAKVTLSIIFISKFARESSSLFVQYASKVLHWPIANAGYVISVKSFISLVLLILLAGMSTAASRRSEAATLLLNRRVVIVSLAMLALGALLIGVSRDAVTLVVGSVFESTGYGIGQALQGTLASFANPSSTGELFAGAALIELLAGLSGTFAFAGLFDLGLQSKFVRRVGLPYFVAAILYAIAVIESLSL
ncbi:major facilitator superfamily transporter [Colletotrichum kahawae]|uniref:Major facilitator superfamily transporter n=1 Tax=Colletotrichum kahawae TaxID=34407 RepID=A0AAD9XWG2_COLKA|nr:major facilitator superfamily transporter [Colletotrichum kahawae]